MISNVGFGVVFVGGFKWVVVECDKVKTAQFGEAERLDNLRIV